MRVGSSHAARVISLWPQLCDRALDSALPHLMAYKRNVKMRLKEVGCRQRAKEQPISNCRSAIF